MLLDPIQSRVLLQFALENRFAVLAVNADSPAAITDCLDAAKACDAPILIETSLWQLTGRSFGSGDPVLGLARYLAQLQVLAVSDAYRDVPVVFHTDHIKGPDTLRILTAAIRGLPAGSGNASYRASTISLDSSELSEAENIEFILRLADIADESNLPLTLEMEAGVDAGVTPMDVADRLLSGVESRNPGKLSLWAPGVGTQHGLSDADYPFSPDAVLRHQQRASEICGRPIGIALHGSSGLSVAALREGIAAGVVKVNWSSESLLIRSQASAQFYASHTGELNKSHPRWKVTAMDHGLQSAIAAAYIPKVVERIRLLGGDGQASLFRVKLHNASRP